MAIPKAKDIEDSLLGLAIKNEKARVTLLSELAEQDFTESNQIIFGAIRSLFNNDEPVNEPSLKNYIREHDLQESVGLEYPNTLINSSRTVNSSGVGVGCDYLKKYTKKRKFLELCREYNSRGQDRSEDTEELLAQAGSDFFDLLSDKDENKEVGFESAIEEGFEEIQKPIEFGIKSDLDLDKITHGFKKGQFVVVAGKTSHGKSCFTQNLMVTAAEKYGHVGFVSMEMSRIEIMERVFSMYCGVPLDRISQRKMNHDDMEKIRDKKEIMKQWDYGFTIVDRGGVHIDQLYAIARRLKMQKDIRMLVVDYLQQVISDGNTREQEVANVSRTLKRIAMDLDISVVGLSQFNRGAGHTERPQMNQLRESGAIEQDANTVILLWNPSVDGKEYFDESDSEGEWAGQSTENIVEFHVSKNRGGKTGTVKLGFEGEHQRFYNLSKINIPGF